MIGGPVANLVRVLLTNTSIRPKVLCMLQVRSSFAGPMLLPLGGLAALLGGGCSGKITADVPPRVDSRPDPSPFVKHVAPWFTDVTSAVGLDFTHQAGESKRYFMPQSMGSGAALLDVDNDGRLDIYLINNDGPSGKARNRLYRQRRDGTFEDSSEGSGLDVAGFGMGAAAGDVNNDGQVDLVLTEFRRTRLFMNDHGKFKETSERSGLDNHAWGCSAAFLDFDRDGWLDLFVANYVEFDPDVVCDDRAGRRDFCGPSTYPGSVSRLFRNLGPSAGGIVRFADVTISSRIGGLKGPGLGAVCADFNADRWPDILVANDGTRNYLWINKHDGSFEEEGVIRGLAYNAMGQPQANMGIAHGDMDGDGLDDIFITHLPQELHVGWKQGPPGYFQDRTGAMGLGAPHWRTTGFGTLFADFDQDGAVDIAIANGAVRRHESLYEGGKADAFWDWYAERNQIFANDAKGVFRDISPDNPDFCRDWGVSRGLACGDIDGDGAPDLLVSRIGATARLFRNTAPRRGHWLMIRAIDEALGGRDAYGAEVTVRAAGRRWKRLVNPSYSYLTANDPRVHFGLGTTDRVDSIEVIWPDGQEEHVPGTAVDRLVVIARGKGFAR